MAPAIIATGMGDGSFDAAMIRTLARMQRAGKPEEVADLVGFVASDHAADISSQMISINGGLS